MMKREPRTQASDQKLVGDLVRGSDERPFRTIYRRHTPRLYSLALRLLGGDVRDAEDAVQETWIRAVEGLQRFRWESAFGTWLGGIAINVCRDTLRRRRRGREGRWDETEEVVAPALSADERLDLERAIAALPDGYRAVLVLHDIEALPHESIAAHLGISVGTSKSQLHRARRALRALLAPPDARRRA